MVDYGQVRQIGITGIMVGALIALGVPVVVLIWGGEVGVDAFSLTILSGLGVGGGVMVSLTSAFFSLVIPARALARAGKAKEADESL